MLSEEHIRRIEEQATLSAKALSYDSLKKVALTITLEHNDAPPGDERTELGIMDSVYTLELGRRMLMGNDA